MALVSAGSWHGSDAITGVWGQSLQRLNAFCILLVQRKQQICLITDIW